MENEEKKIRAEKKEKQPGLRRDVIRMAVGVSLSFLLATFLYWVIYGNPFIDNGLFEHAVAVGIAISFVGILLVVFLGFPFGIPAIGVVGILVALSGVIASHPDNLLGFAIFSGIFASIFTVAFFAFVSIIIFSTCNSMGRYIATDIARKVFRKTSNGIDS